MAYIVFQPGPPGTSARVNISPEAEVVLAFAQDSSGKTIPSLQRSIAQCSKWASGLKSIVSGISKGGKESAEPPSPIDVFISLRRRYEVHGIILDGRLTGTTTRYPCYLFYLERANPSAVILEKVFREKHLSPREQQLVRFLFSDMSNKEIGQALGLSPNTVKGYLKTLALKLGVSSRIGILSEIYKQKN
jgi:DNA-binding CsgD family transcriptional regulator